MLPNRKIANGLIIKAYDMEDGGWTEDLVILSIRSRTELLLCHWKIQYANNNTKQAGKAIAMTSELGGT